MAMPFVQGQLRKKRMSFDIVTECGHCGEPIALTVKEDFSCIVDDPSQPPLMYEPTVDWAGFPGSNIIEAY